MKKLPIAAAALLFGTSAYAMVPSTEPTGIWVDKDAYTVTGTTAVDTAAADSARLQPASADWWTKAEPVAYTAADTGKDVKAADLADAEGKADAGFAAVVDDVDAEIDAAEGEPALEPAVAEPEPASYETNAIGEAPAPVDSGLGGPYEGVDPMAADLTPRPAAANYPACRPGPGDDRCIQLYEPGVRRQLASWSQPTGGFAGSADTQVAMGGPYEAVDDSAIETAHADEALTHEAANGDGSVDTAMGETIGDEEPIGV